MRLSLWRSFIVGVAMGATLLFTSGVASAHDVGPGSNWYWIGTDGGGTIWCAQSYLSFYEYYSAPHDYFEHWSSTAGARDVFCSNAANAPSGYYHTNTRLVWNDGSVCRNWASSDGVNADSSNVAGMHRTLSNCANPGYYFKGQGWHAAALDFNWRYYVSESGSHIT